MTTTTKPTLGIKVVRAYRSERMCPQYRVGQSSRDRAQDYRKYGAKPKLYISHESADGEAENVLQHLFNRHNRPTSVYRLIVKKVLAAAGLDPRQVKAHWSQKAGCSCGCSPAYLLQNIARGNWNFDIHVDIQLTDNGTGEMPDESWLDPAAVKDYYAAQQAKYKVRKTERVRAEYAEINLGAGI